MTRVQPRWIAESNPARHRFVFAVWSSFALIAALVFSGCSGEPSAVSLPTEPLHPVKGSVVLADGKPLTEGEITFVPVKNTSHTATGKIGTDGTFTLKSGDLGDGAAEGEYKIKVESALTVPSADAKKKKFIVPVQFQDEDGSDIRITIKSGPNNLEPIKLVPGKAKTGKASLRD